MSRFPGWEQEDSDAGTRWIRLDGVSIQASFLNKNPTDGIVLVWRVVFPLASVEDRYVLPTNNLAQAIRHVDDRWPLPKWMQPTPTPKPSWNTQ